MATNTRAPSVRRPGSTGRTLLIVLGVLVVLMLALTLLGIPTSSEGGDVGVEHTG